MITLEVITNPEQFYSLRNEWNALLDRTAIDNPYLTHEWLGSWWKAYRQGKQLTVISFKNRGGLIGFIPLVKSRVRLARLPVTCLTFMADHWGRMDFILTEHKNRCINSFLDWYYSSKPAPLMILSRIPKSGETAILLQNSLKERKAKFEIVAIKNAIINLHTDWETFLKCRSKKFRQELKQKQKKISSLGKVSFERTSDLKNIDEVIAILNQVNKKSWKSDEKFAVSITKEGNGFYQDILKQWGTKGHLSLSQLKLNNTPIAFAMRIKYKNTYFAFEASFDKDYHDYSPGLVLQGYLLQELLRQNTLTHYELGEADTHKERWTDFLSTESKFFIYNSSFFPSLVYKLKNGLTRRTTKLINS